jgi:putative cell wall-binding protein
VTAVAFVFGALPLPAAAVQSVPSAEDAARARDLAAAYMQRSVGSDGKFAYIVDMDPEADVPREYNVVRHAGALWSMCDYYGIRPSAGMYGAIGRASAYLRDRRLRPLPGRSDLLAVWSDTEDDGDDPSAKLGGSGLGLVALTAAERVRPGTTSLEKLRALGRFILYMQRGDGSFYPQYVPSRGGRVATPASLYYPGEAALGLLMLYELDPQPVWIQSATKALTYLAASRVNDSDPPPDHWALIATERLLRLSPRAGAQVQVPRQSLLDHVVQVCDAILDDQIRSSSDPRVIGAFSSDGRTTPAATRLEGLQAALATLPSEHPLRPRLRAGIDASMAFLLPTQIAEGRYAGAFPAAVDATEIRIDYVQHALSATMRYAGTRPVISRIAGATRYDTAIAVSRAGWPGGAHGVVIASGADFPDALAAAPLARAYGGPVLLTPSGSLGSAVTQELRRLAPKHVFIAGGTSVVSQTVRTQLASLPSRPAIVRCGGADRYETAALVAKQVKVKLGSTPRLVVCTGSTFGDALSVASLAAARGWPILLAKGGTLTPATRSALSYLAPSSSLLVGSTTRLPGSIAALVPSATRIGGADGPSTSVAVAAWAKAKGYTSLDVLGIATSAGFPDALAVGPYLAQTRGMLLLTPPTGLPSGTASFLVANKGAVWRVRVAGGTMALPEGVVYQLGTRLE